MKSTPFKTNRVFFIILNIITLIVIIIINFRNWEKEKKQRLRPPDSGAHHPPAWRPGAAAWHLVGPAGKHRPVEGKDTPASFLPESFKRESVFLRGKLSGESPAFEEGICSYPLKLHALGKFSNLLQTCPCDPKSLENFVFLRGKFPGKSAF